MFKVVSLFCGAGGLDLGFKKQKFKIMFANDFDKDSCETYKNNIDKNVLCQDIKEIESLSIPDNCDVVLGGFPCQGFSVANNKRYIDDPRNYLYKEMLRVIKDKKPKIFVGENVKGMMTLAKGKAFKQIQEDFQSIGYDVEAKLLNTADFGVPQNRFRIIIIGNNINVKNIFPDDIKKKVRKLKTTENAIKDLKDIPISYNPICIANKKIYNHIAFQNVSDKFLGRKYSINQHDICDYLKEWRNKRKISTKKIDEIFGYRHTAGHWFRKDNNSGSIPKPSDWWRLKKILDFDDKYDKQVTTLEEKQITFDQSLRIVNWDTPSDTITASIPEIHINRERRLSVRECARLQTFPDKFVFYGSLNSMHRQVGNAVPVKFAVIIAKCVKLMLEGEKC
ncbi:MAG: DNA cytosine methyltransferase [Bacteroidetes bacterium]|nr:DNA cytosine methyltransferase [Bacteroidota bacterium]